MSQGSNESRDTSDLLQTRDSSRWSPTQITAAEHHSMMPFPPWSETTSDTRALGH